MIQTYEVLLVCSRSPYSNLLGVMYACQDVSYGLDALPIVAFVAYQR